MTLHRWLCTKKAEDEEGMHRGWSLRNDGPQEYLTAKLQVGFEFKRWLPINLPFCLSIGYCAITSCRE
jgi:hypothetical protein